MRDQCKGLRMSDGIVLEMQQIVRSAAEPWAPGDSVKAGIRRAARQTGLSYRRAETFWHAAVKPAAVRAIEADALRAWHAAWLDRQAEWLETRAAEYRAKREAIEARRGLGADCQGDLGLFDPNGGERRIGGR